MANLENVKVGDRVWYVSRPLGTSYRIALHTVSRVTPKGFYVQGDKDLYRKASGASYSGAQYRHTGVATKAECVEWDAKQESRRLENEAHEAAKKTAEAKRAELRELFADQSPVPDPNTVYVRDAEWTAHEGKHDVTFHGLTEAEVRELAAKVLNKAQG